MDYTVLPLTIPEFIEWLDNLYPERCPDINDSEREIWMKAGERRLVRSLISKLKSTEQKELKGE